MSHAVTARDVIAGTMTEAELLENVRACAVQFGWLFYHTRDSRGSAPGFPDVVLARAPRCGAPDRVLLLAELKTMRGQLSPAQAMWRDALRQCPLACTYALWRPTHWLDGTIEQALR